MEKTQYTREEAIPVIAKFLTVWPIAQLEEYREWCAAGRFSFNSVHCLVGYYASSHRLGSNCVRSCESDHCKLVHRNPLYRAAEYAIRSIPGDQARGKLIVELIDKELATRFRPVEFPVVTTSVKEVVNA